MPKPEIPLTGDPRRALRTELRTQNILIPGEVELEFRGPPICRRPDLGFLRWALEDLNL